MTEGAQRPHERTSARSTPRVRGIRSRALLWVAFVLVHALLVWINLEGPGYPLGDVTGVYLHWAQNASQAWVRMGIDTAWVYPILAAIPMTVPIVFGPEWYGFSWLVMVSALNAVLFALVLGHRRLSRTRCLAAWWWIVFLLALGPIALGRIDAVTVPLAAAGLIFAVGHPRLAALLLTIGAWVKVWPAALGLALVIVSSRRREVLTIALSLSAGIIGVCLLAGSGVNVFGFIAEQSGRGLQIEAPLAVPFLWAIVAGASAIGIEYNRDILTYQITGPGSDAAAVAATPLLVIGVLLVTFFGVRAVRSGAPIGRILAPLALAFVTVLLLANKVGSPQFVTWLAAPVLLGLMLRPARFVVPASVAASVALVTQAIYPYWYGWLLVANPAFVLLLSSKSALVVVLLVWSLRELERARASPGERARAHVAPDVALARAAPSVEPSERPAAD